VVGRELEMRASMTGHKEIRWCMGHVPVRRTPFMRSRVPSWYDFRRSTAWLYNSLAMASRLSCASRKELCCCISSETSNKSLSAYSLVSSKNLVWRRCCLLNSWRAVLTSLLSWGWHSSGAVNASTLNWSMKEESLDIFLCQEDIVEYSMPVLVANAGRSLLLRSHSVLWISCHWKFRSSFSGTRCHVHGTYSLLT
jgi:hypothetical protein